MLTHGCWPYSLELYADQVWSRICSKSRACLKNGLLNLWLQVYTWSSWLLRSHYRIAGNFRMVLIFAYFVCSIPYMKIKTAKIWTYNFFSFRMWPLTYTPTTATCGRQRQVLNARLAHWTMSLYQFFAKASKWSDLSDPSGPLSASITIKEASDASIAVYRTKCEHYQLCMRAISRSKHTK